MWSDIGDIILRNKDSFLEGIYVTLKMCIIVWVIGLSSGFLSGYLRKEFKVINYFFGVSSFVLSGIPVLVFLYWLHYPAQYIIGISVDPFYTAVFMLTLINVFYVSEITYKAILNIPYQYIEVAKILGIGKYKVFKKLEFPLIFRHVLPSIIMTQVSIIHMSLFASLISVNEIFRVSQRIISTEYKNVEVYTALGIFFLLISLPINGIALYLKYKIKPYLNER